MKKSAFTIAEVLITLGIVGVIAVLTIPNLYLGTNSKANSALLKSTYSQVGDAVKKAMIDQGVTNILDLDFGGDTNTQKLANFLRRYLDIAKDCGETTTNCFADAYYNISGTQITNPFRNGAAASSDIVESVLLSNGVAIGLYADFVNEDNCGIYLLIDVNAKKKPNVYGQDTFGVWIDQFGSIGESGMYSSTIEALPDLCRTLSTSAGAQDCFNLLRARDWDLDNYLN